MKYEIKTVDADAGTMTIRYFDEQDLAGIILGVDLPVEEGLFPEGDRLHQLIASAAPTYYFSRSRALTAGIDATHITALIDQVREI